MHVCIQVALRGIAHGIGQSNWAWGGAHQKVGPMSQHRGYHQSRVTPGGSYLHTWCAFCNQLYSRQLKEEQSHTGPVGSSHVNIRLLINLSKSET